jgi:hypothetical protein
MMVVDIVVRDRMAVVDMAEVVGTEEDMAVRVDMAEVETLATQLGKLNRSVVCCLANSLAIG